MNSTERKNARYNRRKSKRLKTFSNYMIEFDNIEEVLNVKALNRACNKAKLGVSWKESVQRYIANRLKNIFKTSLNLFKEVDIRKGFISFDIKERGKLRHINSVHFSERVVQKSLCLNALIPVLSRSLIHDNGASLKGKGISFTCKRLHTHLNRYFHKHKNEGYVLLLDFSNYFASMDHNVINGIIRNYFTDYKIINLVMKFVTAFGAIGVGLGSEVSQILAVAYPNKIDHFIKEKLKIKYYGRYMDDMYLIHHDKEYLWKCLKDIQAECCKIGLYFNLKKTKVVKLSKGFTFLKTQYLLTNSGKIIKKPYKYNITCQRIKLKKFKKLINKGAMLYEQAVSSYASWRGSISKKNSYLTVKNMDRLFTNLFKKGFDSFGI